MLDCLNFGSCFLFLFFSSFHSTFLSPLSFPPIDRMASVVASQDTSCWEINRESYMKVMQDRRSIAYLMEVFNEHARYHTVRLTSQLHNLTIISLTNAPSQFEKERGTFHVPRRFGRRNRPCTKIKATDPAKAKHQPAEYHRRQKRGPLPHGQPGTLISFHVVSSHFSLLLHHLSSLLMVERHERGHLSRRVRPAPSPHEFGHRRRLQNRVPLL